MRFHTVTSGGPNPGITIAGSKEDLAALGALLADAVNSPDPPTHPDGSLRLDEMTVCGDPWNWIVFRVDPKVDVAIEEREKKDRANCVGAALFWAAVCVVIGLAVVGACSLLR